MKTIDTKSVKANNVKKAPKKSNSTIAKLEANNTWKAETFTISALIRYIKREGETTFKAFLKELNKDKGTSITFGQAINQRNIKKFAKDKEVYLKDGSDKTRFSLWFILNTTTRMAKAEAEANKKINK